MEKIGLKIVIDDKIPFIRGVLEPFAKDVLYLPGAKISSEDVKDADALIIRTRTACDKHLLENSSVKFIATATIGFDHIDVPYCTEHNIRWTNAAACNSESVNQYITSVLFTLAEKYNINLSKSTLGVIGLGNVGSKVAQTAKQLGMRVLLNDPPRQKDHEKKEAKGNLDFCELRNILKEADFITLHVPLLKSGKYPTYHLVDDTFLSSMKNNAIIINSSRGSVVDNCSLKKALRTQQICAGVLDVFENEPNIDRELLELLAIATPHIAGYSADGKANGTSMSIQALSSFFNLELNDWYPENIPLTENHQIKITDSVISNYNALKQAVFESYNVINDDFKLRKDPSKFEKLRGDYPIRREFRAFTVVSNNLEHSIISFLEKNRFKIIET